MHSLLKAIKTGTTTATVVSAILTIPIRVNGQNRRVTESPDYKTQSSVSKPGNTTMWLASNIPCVVSGLNPAIVKSQMPPATRGQRHHVDLSWKASNSPSVLKYNVHRCSPGGRWSIIATVPGTTYSDAQVEPSKAYCYFVTAAAAKGPDSDPSNVVEVVVPSP